MKIKSFVITIALTIAVLGFGFGTNAQTTDTQALIAQLQAQILSLMQQIATLIAQQNGTQTWCHTFNTNLRIGDTGVEVEALQLALGKDGGLVYDKNTNSIFDEYNASAVVAFQEKYTSEILTPSGLRRGTGFVGPATRKKLNALYSCTTSPNNQPSITVFSPNGGETLKIGQSHTISWKSNNVNNVNIAVVNYDHAENCLINDKNSIASKNGINYFTFNFDKCTVHNMGMDSVTAIDPGSNYKINIVDALGGTSDSSDNYFTIAQNLDPYIEVLQPENSLKEGGVYNIKWKQSGLGDKKVNIYLIAYRGTGYETGNGMDIVPKLEYQYSSNQLYLIAKDVNVSQNGYDWNIPVGLSQRYYSEPANYRIQLGDFTFLSSWGIKVGKLSLSQSKSLITISK